MIQIIEDKALTLAANSHESRSFLGKMAFLSLLVLACGQSMFFGFAVAETPEKGDRAACEAERVKALQATELARRLLPRGEAVRLSDFGRDRYGRLLAAIRLADGRDLASVMIGAGLAVPYEGGEKASWCQPFRRRHRDGSKRGLSAPSTVKGKCRAAPVIGGRDAPKIRKRIAARPPGFRRYPARPPTLDRAPPDFTTGKRCGAQDLATLPGTLSEDLS